MLLGFLMPCCGVGKLAVCCAHGNERWVSVKWGEFLDYLRNC